VGRVQPFLPFMLYDIVGETKQKMSIMSTRLGSTAYREIDIVGEM